MANPANGAASPLTVDGLTNNQTYFARVRARNAAGWGPWSDLSVPFTPKAGLTVVTAPRISTDGSPAVGETISCDDGSWSQTPSDIAKQWKRGTVDVGNDGSTYTLVPADAGQPISCVVTAVDAVGGAVSATSNVITPAGQAPVNTTAPTISTDGSPAVGETVTATTGLWSGTSPLTYTYQWRQAPGVNVGNGSSSYTIDSNDAGLTLWCLVTATNAVGSATVGTSNVITPASQGGGGSGTVVPMFDGTRLSAWSQIQVSNPPTLESSNHPAPGGTDVVERATDPLGVVPGPVIDLINNEVDHVGDRVRAQAVSGSIIQLNGTYWFRRIVGIPSDYPLVEANRDVNIGTYFGPPYSGTSTLPNFLRNWNGANHFAIGRTSQWNTPIWHTPATPGWHKLILRLKMSTSSTGFLEVYYGRWGQPLVQQQLVVADSGGTLANGGLRLNMTTIGSQQANAANTMRVAQYRYYPMSSFTGKLTHIYYYKPAIFDDADVSSVNDVDPE
jgi:hypothetical protein